MDDWVDVYFKSEFYLDWNTILLNSFVERQRDADDDMYDHEEGKHSGLR